MEQLETTWRPRTSAPGSGRLWRKLASLAQGYALACGIGLTLLLPSDKARAQDDAAACFAIDETHDHQRRILDCSALIEVPGLGAEELARAYALRALSYSLIGDFSKSIRDYDSSIKLDPDNATALNNRAWALFKSGQSRKGLPDVERSLDIEPSSPHALDTRAHIRHIMGETIQALADYEHAMDYGGERIVKLYQCGLQNYRLYKGPLDGLRSAELAAALRACLAQKSCDPLPPDEECRASVS